MKLSKLPFLALLLLLAGCFESPYHSQGPEGMDDKIKPVYLGNKFLRDGDEKGFKATLSKKSREIFEKECARDPKFFRRTSKKIAPSGKHKILRYRQNLRQRR